VIKMLISRRKKTHSAADQVKNSAKEGDK